MLKRRYLKIAAWLALAFSHFSYAHEPVLIKLIPIDKQFIYKIPDHIIDSKSISNARETRSNDIEGVANGAPNIGWSLNIGFGGQDANEKSTYLLLDTGSSNTGISDGIPCSSSQDIIFTNTSTASDPFRSVSVSYSGGSWNGELYRDYVSIEGLGVVYAQLAAIKHQSRFCIGSSGWNGIFGLAQRNLAKPDASVTPLLDEFISANQLPDIFALEFCPQNYSNNVQQESVLSVGGVSYSMIQGAESDMSAQEKIVYIPFFGDDYYRTLIYEIRVNNQIISVTGCEDINRDKTFFDSGTTEIFLHTALFNAVIQAFERELPEVDAVFWEGGSVLCWQREEMGAVWNALPSIQIYFQKEGSENEAILLTLTPTEYLRNINDNFKCKCVRPKCLVFRFAIRKRNWGNIIGSQMFLTAIYDREQRRIGLAKSSCEHPIESNFSSADIDSVLYPVPDSCHEGVIPRPYWEVIVYACGSIVTSICAISLSYGAIKKSYMHRHALSSYLHRMMVFIDPVIRFMSCNYRLFHSSPIQETVTEEMESE